MRQMMLMISFLEKFEASTIVFIAFLLMIVMCLAGFKLNNYLLKRESIGADIGFGVIEGAMLSLFAFFLGFTFSMANDRFDRRRDAIVNEANAIGTAVLRANLYQDGVRVQLLDHFRKYVELRIDYFEAKKDEAKTKAALTGARNERDHLWAIASRCLRASEQIEANRQMIPAMNNMFDAATSRETLREERVPESIIRVMLTLSICSAFIVGFSLKERPISYVISLVFIVMVSITVYLILDLDRSREGMITTEHTNQKIIDLRELFK